MIIFYLDLRSILFYFILFYNDYDMHRAYATQTE
jgi:hypothetical protein